MYIVNMRLPFVGNLSNMHGSENGNQPIGRRMKIFSI